MIPQDLKFAKTHEWARLDEGSGVVTVGISHFAVEQLGDIVFLELPPPGEPATKEAPFGVIESVKAAIDIEAPVSGEVAESNQTLPDSLDTLGEDPYGAGWMVKIKVSDPTELDSLMNAAEYETYISSPGVQK